MTSPLDPRIDEPLSLPAPAPPPRRAPWPLLAAIVPVVGGVAMWLVTGSILSLCFAALGPLMAVASIVDGRRGSRREKRRADAEHAEACARVEQEVARRHERERAELLRRDVDAGALLADERRVWRVPADELVVGRGDVGSRVRVTGGEGERADGLRARASVLADAPVTIALDEGVCVRGDRVTARAVARALLLQLCLRSPPAALAVVAAPEDEDWAARLPHRRADAPDGVHRVAFAVDAAATRVRAGTVIAATDADGVVPDACGAIIEVDGPLRGRLLRGTQTRSLALEAVSAAQAGAAADALAERSGADGRDAPDPQVTLGALEPVAAAAGGARLPVVIGASGGSPAVVDIVADGPHAVVVGTTGAGKSELLTTWVASLARTYTPDRVVLLLADFKGGTAFEPLAHLPHVTGVITDLDGAASRRAVESLRAELRRREARIAGAGARDVSDPGVGLPRLVIFVDEFAAMLQEHPDLHAVFSDVAARGRALGMHLVLGTQRSSGVLRDALVANCPLRIALRVAERAESRGVIGSDEAAELSGGEAARGLAYVRRAADVAPQLTRIALTTAPDLAAIAATGARTRASGPWLPPLPSAIGFDAALARARDEGADGDAVILGVADDPERQRQPVVLLRPGVDRGLVVIGGGGSGKTGIVRLVASQTPDALVVPRDAEGAWDAVARAESEPARLLVVDDVDALLGRYPHDYAQIVAERLEGLVRDAGELRMTVLLTTARITGAVSRIIDPLPRRALLALATRAEHAAAGGDGASFVPGRPPGRGVLDGGEVQFALAPDAASAPADRQRSPEPRPWRPTAEMTALVVRAPHRRRVALAEGWGADVRIVLVDEIATGIPLGRLAEAGAHPVVVAGDPESWQRQWGLLQEARARLPIVVGAECAAELRAVTGERELPPYARTRASRAWLLADGRPPERIVLP
ncbi:FtsK/SpoIIIE domain-containing protein [Microbacterium betulae]|uniref:FtsK/SpoIIIE domain-containing protein n=1 Tax=Microbacterium betulae TaxID=2981139 RepID=A0AA97I625_9MICO|nr:FtsK/SpoIIIE domain-containing protein [Microbacterium sp. AB]WOF22095.1 FtsK/SpoIIIE domain-containing protein [Microbacterium sp. AB]